jgi:hypothetical protein
VELGPESAAPCAKIVVEAKEDASCDLAAALAEIETARHNRDAESGLFVFSKKTAPAGLEPLARYGNDVVVVWDADDVATDTHLRLGLSVARALCTRKALERSSLDVDFTAIDAALLEITKQVKELDDIRTWTDTIRSNGQKILDRLRISTEKLEKQGAVLTERVADLKEAMVKE